MILEIPEAEQQLILAAINNLPPISWLQECTKDQLICWKEVKAEFQLLHQELKAYFSGQSTTLHSLSKESRELLAQLRDFYLALYGLLHEGWDEMIRVFVIFGGFSKFEAALLKSQGWSSVTFKRSEDLLKLESPGQVLITLMENAANAQVHQSFITHDFRPRHRYDLHRINKTINLHKVNLQKGYPVEKIKTTKAKPLKPKKRQRNSGKNIIDTYRDEVLRSFPDFGKFAMPEICCVHACRIAAKLNNNETLERKIKEYEIQKDLLNKLIQREFKQGKGYVYRRGCRY